MLLFYIILNLKLFCHPLKGGTLCLHVIREVEGRVPKILIVVIWILYSNTQFILCWTINPSLSPGLFWLVMRVRWKKTDFKKVLKNSVPNAGAIFTQYYKYYFIWQRLTAKGLISFILISWIKVPLVMVRRDMVDLPVDGIKK